MTIVLRPLSALRSLFAKRQIEAASPRRFANRPMSGDSGSWIRGGAEIVSSRAQSYALNNPHGAKMAQALPDQIVGTGIKPVAQVEAEETRRRLHRAFAAWTDRSDATGLTDFYGLQHHAARDMVVHGEALLVWTVAADGTPQLARLHPEQLDRSVNRIISVSAYIVQGVEFDAQTGAAVAYHIRPGNAGTGWADSWRGATGPRNATPPVKSFTCSARLSRGRSGASPGSPRSF